MLVEYKPSIAGTLRHWHTHSDESKIHITVLYARTHARTHTYQHLIELLYSTFELSFHLLLRLPSFLGVKMQLGQPVQ
jgi:hypothetical protein